MNIPVCVEPQNDKWFWAISLNGEFSVNSAYCALNGEASSLGRNTVKWKIWKSKLHERLKMLLWRIASEILPTREQLGRFYMDLEESCPLCGIEKETMLHLFTKCSLSRALWFGSTWGARLDSWHFDSPLLLIDHIINPPLGEFIDVFQKDIFTKVGARVIDLIWKIRN